LQKVGKCGTVYKTPSPQFVPIRIAGKLICEFDSERGILRFQDRKQLFYVDLAEYSNGERAEPGHGSHETI